jgi:hypothetical protein
VSRLGIIVPFRKRWHHLWEFIPHYKRRLPQAHIYVIEQYGTAPFNRAKLLNVGFRHYSHSFTYFAAHDVDMLITKGAEHYLTPPDTVAQLATHCQQFRYKMPFAEYMGGVTLFENGFFEMIGGYSNHFWGYGGEDNELYYRVKWFGAQVEYRDGWYQCLHHPPSHPMGVDWAKMEQAKQPRAVLDGVSFAAYDVVDEGDMQGATRLLVKI